MKWAKVIATIWIFLDIGTWATYVGHPEVRPEITGGSWFLAFVLAVIVIIGLGWEKS